MVMRAESLNDWKVNREHIITQVVGHVLKSYILLVCTYLFPKLERDLVGAGHVHALSCH